jgi:hypothetical protein
VVEILVKVMLLSRQASAGAKKKVKSAGGSIISNEHSAE